MLFSDKVCSLVAHSSSSSIAGAGRGVWAASAAETISPIDVKAAKRFCRVSLSTSYKLALCFLRGLPTTESSGRFAPKTLLERRGGIEAGSAGGGVAPWELVPDAGDLRALEFRGSAEC